MRGASTPPGIDSGRPILHNSSPAQEPGSARPRAAGPFPQVSMRAN